MYYLVSWPLLVTLVVGYLLGLLLYRLTIHPLSRFPGPKWTAITRYYEGLYDVIQNGQYTFKIAEMHRKYGPIIRISPYEVHVSDPAFFNTLYRQDAPYDKSEFAADAWSAYGATLFTVAHDVHKARRQPLDPYFSKARVASKQNLIHRHLDKLCRRFDELADTQATFDLGASMTALTRDVVNDFVLDKSYNSLDREDFDSIMLEIGEGAGNFWRLCKFLRWIGPIKRLVPVPWIVKFTTNRFFLLLLETQDDVKRLMTEATLPQKDDEASSTIIHKIIHSKLPPSEKEHTRIWEDVYTITGAGFESTASVLRLILFHLYTNPQILQQLRTELSAVSTTSTTTTTDPQHNPHLHHLDLHTLTQLPHLTATITEALRLSPAISTRMPRISPKTDINYNNQWLIPAGTAISMTPILMHMDETLYPDPTRFDPARWIDNDDQDGKLLKKKPELGFAPFSRGTRNCLGRHLAQAEIYLTIALLVQRYDFNFVGGEKAEDFLCTRDSFAIGTKGGGHLRATVVR